MVCGLPKKLVQRYFFHFKIPLRYKDIENLLSLISQSSFDVQLLPKRYTAHNMIQIKRALEDCRRNEGVFTRELAEAETNLVETAADMGDSTAIALLCGSRLQQPNVTKEDMDSGSDLLQQLMDSNFALAFKISGDLAVKFGRPNEAVQFYKKALERDINDNRLEVECLRNLGYFYLKKSQLITARDYFSRSCELAEDPKQILDCHFMLAQLREPDKYAARAHYEFAAGFGFKNAFVPLGSLLLNWFNEPVIAREWFKLACATDTTGEALIGLLDAAAKLEQWQLAHDTTVKIQNLTNGAELLAQREQTVRKVEQAVGGSVSKDSLLSPEYSSSKPSGRFDF